MVTNNKAGIVKLIISGETDNVPKKEGTLITPKVLKMLEPVMFPIAISAFPFFAATAETTNSGKEVPMAIADTAIISVPIFRILDISITA